MFSSEWQSSKLNLIYECVGEMGMTDRLGDKMQRKLHEFQVAQVARQAQAHNLTPNFAVSPRQKPRTANSIVSNEGFICGSSVFQEVAAFSSSYDGQV